MADEASRPPVPYEDSETVPGAEREPGADTPFRRGPAFTQQHAETPAASFDVLIGGTIAAESDAAAVDALPWDRRAIGRAQQPLAAPPAPLPAPIAPPAFAVAPPPPAYVPQPSGYVHGAPIAPPAVVAPVAHDAAAAQRGVAAASHAAADAPRPFASAEAATGAASAPRPAEMIELLWIDESKRASILRRFRSVLEDLEPAELPDDEVAPDDVLEILVRAPRTERVVAAVERQLALTGARFVAPMIVITGQVVLAIAATEILRGVHQILATVHAPGKVLSDALEGAERALRASILLGDDAAERHIESLHVAASPGTRSAAWPIRAAVLRAAIQRRDVPRAIVYGAEHARLLLEASTERVVAYAATTCLSSLPAVERFRGVLIAEVRPRPTDEDESRYALRVLAIGAVHATGA